MAGEDKIYNIRNKFIRKFAYQTFIELEEFDPECVANELNNTSNINVIEAEEEVRDYIGELLNR